MKNIIIRNLSVKDKKNIEKVMQITGEKVATKAVLKAVSEKIRLDLKVEEQINFIYELKEYLRIAENVIENQRKGIEGIRMYKVVK